MIVFPKKFQSYQVNTAETYRYVRCCSHGRSSYLDPRRAPDNGALTKAQATRDASFLGTGWAVSQRFSEYASGNSLNCVCSHHQDVCVV